jgi:hypothetical protein
MSESGKSKGKRFLVLSLVVLIIGMALPSIGAGLGGLSLTAQKTVLSPESTILYVDSGNYTAVPFSESNGTGIISVPVNQTALYLETNLTLGDLNEYNVQKITLATGYNGPENVSLGYGGFRNFTTLEYEQTNGTVNFSLNPSMLTGDQSNAVYFKIVSGTAHSYTITITAYGNLALITSYGGLQASYYIGAVILFIGGMFGMAFAFDVDISRKKGRGKR